MNKMSMPHIGHNAWMAYRDETSGMVAFDGSDFVAIRSTDHYFSALGKGRRGMLGSPRDADGKISIEIYMLSAILFKDLAPLFARRCRIAFYLKGGGKKEDFQMIDNPEAFDSYVGGWFVALARNTNGLHQAAKWVENIPKSFREMSDTEDDFLQSVQQAAEDSQGVPTQAAVRRLWLSKDCDRSADSFPDVRDVMGFEWLPSERPGRPKSRA